MATTRLNPDQRAKALAHLESLVDISSIGEILSLLADICGEKAEHVAANWQDEVTAKIWSRAELKLDRLSVVVEV